MDIQKTSIVLVACLVAMSVAFSCEPCTKKVCRFSEDGVFTCNEVPRHACQPVSEDCPEIAEASGCRCCDSCAKLEGESCTLDVPELFGGAAGSLGVPCASDLTCRPTDAKNRFSRVGTCQP